MPPSDYSKQIADELAKAGLKMPDADAPSATLEPAPSPPVGTASLPPDVAARVNQQNAIADTSAPQTIAPPAPPAVVRATPPQAAQPQAASPTPQAGAGFAPIGATYDAQIRAQRDANAGAVAANEAQSAGSAMLGDQQRRDAEAAQQRAREQDAQTQNQLAEIHQLSQEAAAKQVDPSRWWHNQSAGAKVLYTLSAALGGFAAGWTHGPNQAMAQINRYIDDDIGAQKTAIEQAHGKVADARGVLGEMYQRFGNMNQAESAARLLHYDSMINDVKAQTASASSPAIEANGNVVLAELERKKQEEKLRFSAAGAAKQVGLPDVQKYTEALNKAEIPESEASLNRVREIAAQKDPAGLGVGGRFLHEHGLDFLLSQEGRNNNSDVDTAVLKIAHATGRVTPQEVEAVRRAYVGSIGNPAAMKHFAENVGNDIAAKKGMIQAGTDPRVVQYVDAVTAANQRRTNKAGLPPGSGLQ